MELNSAIRFKIIKAYVIIFYLIMVYKLVTNQFLFQLSPSFFFNKLDVSTWLIMLTDIHNQIIKSKLAAIFFDAIFYILPILYFLSIKWYPRYSYVVGVLMLIVNISYAAIYCSFPTVSIEGFIAFLLFPFLFIVTDLRNFWFVLHGLRFYFLYFFLSAGIWKFVQGGIFNKDQMSGILLYQHKELFVLPEPSLLITLYQWLIIHPYLSYSLYVLATILELSFAIGFITRRFDKWLMLFFILFLTFDYLLMQINYITVLPFLIPLYFSGYLFPGEKENALVMQERL